MKIFLTILLALTLTVLPLTGCSSVSVSDIHSAWRKKMPLQPQKNDTEDPPFGKNPDGFRFPKNSHRICE